MRRYLTLPLVAYVILASSIAYTIHVERQHSAEARNAIVSETHRVLLNGCVRGNKLRNELQQLVLANIPMLQRYVIEGTLTQKQANRAIRQAKIAARKVGPINCAKAYPSIKPEK